MTTPLKDKEAFAKSLDKSNPYLSTTDNNHESETSDYVPPTVYETEHNNPKVPDLTPPYELEIPNPLYVARCNYNSNNNLVRESKEALLSCIKDDHWTWFNDDGDKLFILYEWDWRANTMKKIEWE